MNKEKVEILVEGGKATTGPQIGQKFGPLGVNIQEILKQINEKTDAFKGMKVPVKVEVDKDTKEFTLIIGTPPVSELIKKELSIEKGSGTPNKEKINNIAIEQVIKIAKMKQDSMLVNNLKSAVKSVIGSCNSLGILVEGKTAREINKDIESGKYDEQIRQQKTEINKEKREELMKQLEVVQRELKKELEKLQKELKEEIGKVEKEEVKEVKKEEKVEETKKEVGKEEKREEKIEKKKKE